MQPGDRFTVHKVGREEAQTVGDGAEEEGLAEFDLDSKGTLEILEVRENAAKGKFSGSTAVQKGDAVRYVKKQ